MVNRKSEEMMDTNRMLHATIINNQMQDPVNILVILFLSCTHYKSLA